MLYAGILDESPQAVVTSRGDTPTIFYARRFEKARAGYSGPQRCAGKAHTGMAGAVAYAERDHPRRDGLVRLRAQAVTVASEPTLHRPALPGALRHLLRLAGDDMRPGAAPLRQQLTSRHI
jgi:hypothetical protein